MADIQRFERNHRRSRVVVHGDTVYLAGQVSPDSSGDIAAQTKGALDNVDKMLALAGTDKSKVLSVTIWLRDMADFDAMNVVYDAWVDSENAPARACGAVPLASPDIRVEILVIAAR
jgi:enamine deaminase RidA (YjgF/YER057c/UK114 family)